MNDGHSGKHEGMAPACVMWAPILPIVAPAASPVSAAKDESGSREASDDAASARNDGADKGPRKS